MRSYFQVINEADKTSLKLFIVDGPIRENEVIKYLDRHMITYTKAEVGKEVSLAKESKTILLNRKRSLPIKGEVQVEVSPDKMEAIGRFYPPSNDGEPLSETAVIDELRSKGIVYGVLKSAIDDFFRDKEYCCDYVLAKGKPVRQGSDARIEYFFNTNLKAKPTLNPDGSVDFFHLNIINHVQRGDRLAKLHPEDPGEDGKDVLGGVIRPKGVKREFLKFGKNVEMSDDHLELFSEVDGHVTLNEKKVIVSNVMVVENVDLSTGDIEYKGNLQVNGNVSSNFKIHVDGNVEVRGVVEGAEIVAEGNITIARGVNGMGKGYLKAGGNIVAKFIENGTVEARGYVQSDSILHSHIMAGTEIRVDGKRGFITGGHVCATNLIEVKVLGSELGANTTVEIGVPPEVKQRYEYLKEELEKCNKTINSAKPILENAKKRIHSGKKLSPDQVKHVQELSNVVTRTQKNIEIIMKELIQLEELVSIDSDAQIVVKGQAYPGTKLVIGDVSKMIKTPVQYCRFIKQKGDVTMVGMN